MVNPSECWRCINQVLKIWLCLILSTNWSKTVFFIINSISNVNQDLENITKHPLVYKISKKCLVFNIVKRLKCFLNVLIKIQTIINKIHMSQEKTKMHQQSVLTCHVEMKWYLFYMKKSICKFKIIICSTSKSYFLN